MLLIKLNATESTNTYLKKLANEIDSENFTVVSALKQTHGKGQMGAVWQSEEGKNMIFSVLLKNSNTQTSSIFELNKIVSISLIHFMKQFEIPDIAVKWPNDILAGTKKIAGVLIENVFKHDGTIDCIVGIGVNVNQSIFIGLPNATSVYCETNKIHELDQLILNFCELLKNNFIYYQNNRLEVDNQYHNYLFKKDKLAVFENNERLKFMGIIQGVDEHGSLVVALENDEKKKFKLKEIKMVF